MDNSKREKRPEGFLLRHERNVLAYCLGCAARGLYLQRGVIEIQDEVNRLVKCGYIVVNKIDGDDIHFDMTDKGCNYLVEYAESIRKSAEELKARNAQKLANC